MQDRKIPETTQTISATDVMTNAEMWTELKVAMKEIERLQTVIRDARDSWLYGDDAGVFSILKHSGVQ